MNEKPQFPELKLVLDSEGEFYFNGKRVENRRVRRLFHRHLVRTPEGKLELHLGHQKATIEVEDCPFFAERLIGKTKTGLLVRGVGGDTFEIDPASIRYRKSKGDFIARRVSDGESVRFLRTAGSDLGTMLEEDEQGRPFIEINGKRFYITEI